MQDGVTAMKNCKGLDVHLLKSHAEHTIAMEKSSAPMDGYAVHSEIYLRTRTPWDHRSSATDEVGTTIQVVLFFYPTVRLKVERKPHFLSTYL